MKFIICFLLKTLLDLNFLEWTLWPPLLLSAVFYFLTYHFHSICQDLEFTLLDSTNQYCNICRHNKTLRMKHCDICVRCIHKYDHHCNLMEVCIGQFNHKYYILFLGSYIVSQLIVNYQSLKFIGNQVSLDQNGIENRTWKYYALAFQLCVYGLVLTCLCCFLLARHLRLMLGNSTTWEENRRADITYMQSIPVHVSHPFSEGCFRNLCSELGASRKSPVLWKLPLYR